MFKTGVKKEALKALEKVQADYAELCERAQVKAEKLLKLRQSTSLELIPEVEMYVNSLANTPKDFDKSFADYKAEFTVFNSILHELQLAAKEAQIKAVGVAAVGIAGGRALLALLPLAGPIGLAIDATAVVFAGLFARSKNGKIADQAIAARKELEVYTRTIKAATLEIDRMLEQTDKHANGMREMLAKLKQDAPADYKQFNTEMRQIIGALINHVYSLSELLNKKVGVS